MEQSIPKDFNVHRAPGPPARKLGLLGCIAAPVLLAGLALAVVFLLIPALRTGGLRGEFLNAAAVPGPGGTPLLWILTDGSLHYIRRVETPGRTEIGRRCISCKTWLYVYDPLRKEILSRFRTDYETIIVSSWMVPAGGKIWVVTGPYDKNDPRLYVYGAEPAALLGGTGVIVGRHPELSSGLTGVRMEKNPARLVLDTRDGRTGLVLSLEEEKLYESEADFRTAAAPRGAGTATMFALGLEGSGPRKRLFRLTGPAGALLAKDFELRLSSPAGIPPSYGISVEPAAPGRVFIEGEIFQQDADGCLIVHQDAAGKSAGRLLTRVGRDGSIAWTAGQDILFREMRVDTDRNPLSSHFFIRNDLDVSRSGDVILLQLRGVGAAGFDLATGRKLWEVKP
jgi:hypothetical protein